jgi:25S rRNA (cytosine2870-C5)-methyltransferase
MVSNPLSCWLILQFSKVRGPVQELELGDSEDDGEALPKGAAPSSDEDESDEDAPITGKNIEARSRALDEQAALDAALDEEEMQNNAAPMADGEEDIEVFDLPTAEQREEEKGRGGPDVQEVQRRMQECAKVLGDFKRFGNKGRYVYHRVRYGPLKVMCFL